MGDIYIQCQRKMTSKATKRKIVTKEAVDDYFVPEDDEEIVKIVASRGNNLHEVENASGSTFLVSMPTKFRKNIWVKRGDFVVTVPIKEGNKVQGEIVYILLAKQIKYLKDEKLWPEAFDQNIQKEEKNIEEKKAGGVEPVKMNGHMQEESDNSDDSDSEDDTDDEIFQNPNHRPMYYYEDSDDESTEEEDEEDEDADDEDDDEDDKLDEKTAKTESLKVSGAAEEKRNDDYFGVPNQDADLDLSRNVPKFPADELMDAIARVKLK